MAEINEIIHQPVRLKVMAALAALSADAEADFSFLRDHLKLTDGNLGAHLEKLEAAGYLTVRKAFVGRKPRTFVQLSLAGRRAFEDYLAVLRGVLNPAPAATAANPAANLASEKQLAEGEVEERPADRPSESRPPARSMPPPGD